MKNLIVLLSLFYSFNLFASFEGEWSGSGDFATNRRSGDCSQVYLKLKESDQQLKLVTGNYKCEDIQAEYPFSKFDKKQGQLYFHDEVVGTYSNDEIYLSYYDKTYQLTLHKTADEMQFNELWNDGKSVFSIKAKLNKISE